MSRAKNKILYEILIKVRAIRIGFEYFDET